MPRTQFGDLEEICRIESITTSFDRNGPKLLTECCKQIFYCRCIEEQCRSEERLNIHCGKCLYHGEICDEIVCNFWREKSMLPSIGLMALIVIDVLFTIITVIVIILIELRRKRSGEFSTIWKSRLLRTRGLESKIPNKDSPINDQNKSIMMMMVDEEIKEKKKRKSKKRSSKRFLKFGTGNSPPLKSLTQLRSKTSEIFRSPRKNLSPPPTSSSDNSTT